jgi:hypothetical protein
MTSQIRRITVSTLLFGCVTVLGPVAAAQATDATIAATVKNDLPKITRSQARILDGIATLQKNNAVTPLIRAIKAQNRNLTTLRKAVMSQTASTSGGSQGQSDIVTGLQLIVRSNTTLSKDLARSAKGEAFSKRRLKAAVAAEKRGNRDIDAGGKLLSV